MIRDADHGDIPQLVEFFLVLKRNSDYVTITHNLDEARATIRRCISSPQGYAKIAITEEGRLTGCLIGVIDKHWWTTRRWATDLAFFSQRPGDGAQLLKDFCTWAWHKGVIEVLLAQSTGCDVERTARWYEAQGFSRVGGVFRLMRHEAMDQESAA